VPNLPREQAVHSEAVAASAAEKCPKAQFAQKVLPLKAWNVPAWQSSHALDPGAAAKRPGVHGVHTFADVALPEGMLVVPAVHVPVHECWPVLPSNLPLGQISQEMRAPGALAKRPARHGTHCVLLSEKWPAVHGMPAIGHQPAFLPAALQRPTGQVVHVV